MENNNALSPNPRNFSEEGNEDDPKERGRIMTKKVAIRTFKKIKESQGMEEQEEKIGSKEGSPVIDAV